MTGNDDLKTYELIVYKDKQNILVRAKIGASFTYNLLRDNYASFFDDQQQNWSALFDNTGDYNDFCAELKKRNVKVEEPKTEDDNNPHREELKKVMLSRLAKLEEAVSTQPPSILSDDYVDTDSDQSNVSRRSRKSKRPAVSVALQPKPNNNQIVPIKNQQQQQTIALPAMDPVGLLLAENRTHNCEVRMNLNEISTKLNTVLQRIEDNQNDATTSNLREKKIVALELKIANLQRELDEALTDNVELHKKLLDTNRTERLEKQLQEQRANVESLEAENKSLKQYETFAKEIAHCSNLADVKNVCNKKYDGSDELLNNTCKTLNKILVENDVKAAHFVGTLTMVMEDFQKYIVKHYDAETSRLPENFVSKLLPKSVASAKNYLINEFEIDFKISNKESQRIFRPIVILSENDD